MSHLSIHERRALAGIERGLTKEDPEFARALSQRMPEGGPARHRRQAAGYVLLVVAGAALFLAALAVHGVGAVLAVVLLVGVGPSCLWSAAEAFERHRREAR
ncbi:hypothetical protein GCM10010495_60030 [Kitasatospora herbaricolor]|uniref:DUF3040 domain-containing protein n=1 Tax=Kitasatospora herbaricolor TaxID=68217 RepID=UPI00174AF1BB|nr:DUF3040 domain-containing protein [Kitasatospora herbaricolor]MDQ0312683.1 hypothetical protein [Kitasatospora herbaricolor]GGV35076.1 hypothetical protein GCM10010495_60030 [Kitasatospora herbaricolor]